MAEGSPTASGSRGIRVTEYRFCDEGEITKQAFSSALWNYTAHKYNGDIVQGQCHSVNLIACRALK